MIAADATQHRHCQAVQETSPAESPGTRLSTSFFMLARNLIRMPEGSTSHPGIPAAQVQTLARRIDSLSRPLEETMPRTAKTVRDTALALASKHRLTGLSRAETFEVVRWLCQVGGFVAAVTEPLDGE